MYLEPGWGRTKSFYGASVRNKGLACSAGTPWRLAWTSTPRGSSASTGCAVWRSGGRGGQGVSPGWTEREREVCRRPRPDSAQSYKAEDRLRRRPFSPVISSPYSTLSSSLRSQRGPGYNQKREGEDDLYILVSKRRSVG